MLSSSEDICLIGWARSSRPSWPGAGEGAGQEQEKELGQEQENGWSLRLMASVVTTSCGEAGTIPIKVF